VRRVRGALLAVALLGGFARGGVAQGGTAAVPAEAIVVTVGMTLTTLRDLGFGGVVRGVATTVSPAAAGAGAWQVTGNPNAFASISFTLPAVLTNIQALPGSTMPISFDATSARWRRATNDPAGATPFDPAAGTTGRFGPPPNPNLYIWVGGTVNPAATAKPGIYQGTIVVSLSYL
jgi:hypothetical protein